MCKECIGKFYQIDTKPSKCTWAGIKYFRWLDSEPEKKKKVIVINAFSQKKMELRASSVPEKY